MTLFSLFSEVCFTYTLTIVMPKRVNFRISLMKKRQDARMKGKLEALEKDYSTFRMTKHVDLGRLLRPKEFPLKNQDRLKRDFTKGVIEELNDIEVVFPRLSAKYQRDVLTSDQFYRTVNVFLDNAANLQKTKSKGFENVSNSIMYQNFFNIGLEGLINTMPPEFREILISQIKPTLQLMLAITKNHNKISKNKIPEPQFPKLVITSKLNDTK